MKNAMLVIHAIVTAPLRTNVLRATLSVVAIALGVALGVAVNLINASAVAEFSRAVQTLSGDADLVVRGPQSGFDESLYPRIAVLPEIARASPMIQLDVKIHGARDFIQVIGIDPFQSPHTAASEISTKERNLLELDTVIVSSDIAERLDLAAGSKLVLDAGAKPLAFEVIGILPHGFGAVAIMDIANAQWRFGMLGKVNRIDLKLKPEVSIGKFEAKLHLPAGVHVLPPEHESEETSELSRAYRVNLNMLSIVALFTGAFLVYSTQALSIAKKRSHLALLQVLGLRRQSLLSLVMLESALIGAVGGVLGVIGGISVGELALRTIGPDLGAGYFRGSLATLEVDPAIVTLFFLLGVVAAVAGALIPALRATGIAPAQALKAGPIREAPRKTGVLAGALALGLGVAASFAPPVAGLPLFGYTGIGFILLGACLLMPALLKSTLALVPQPHGVQAQLALLRLKASPNDTALSISAIFVAFSVMAAMAIMVASFRGSLSGWLIDVLPADLYVRARGDAAYISEETQRELAKLKGVERIEFSRYRDVRVGTEGLPLALIARDKPWTLAGMESPGNAGRSTWISEAAADLYGYKVGRKIQLPMAGRNVDFTVAGIWRDYARTTGAVAIERDLYVALTEDTRANDAALWLASDASPDVVRQAIGGELEITTNSELHSRSLRAFDRTFAVTYVLEGVAVLVGLFGVSASFGARVLDRRSEFAMLRHLGATRRFIAAMLGAEGAFSGALGTLLGLILGTGLSLILIFVINRQSFHWSMDLHFPWGIIAGLSLAMVVAAALTAILSARKAMGDDVLAAVREDW
ncbi:MAG: FtsX-like permease family protein [Burkholderiales bacterium]